MGIVWCTNEWKFLCFDVVKLCSIVICSGCCNCEEIELKNRESSVMKGYKMKYTYIYTYKEKL